MIVVLGGVEIYISGLPTSLETADSEQPTKGEPHRIDTVFLSPSDALLTDISQTDPSNPSLSITNSHYQTQTSNQYDLKTSGFEDVDPKEMIGNHPFRKEALKLLTNKLEETDSLSRRKILSYCEHLRTSYTTKDIDFIRQVFSDNALIIVGTVVKPGKKWNGENDKKVTYAVRSKQSYISKLNEVFAANKSIKVDFSDFHIMRHPSLKGIYGVSLRQKYSTDKYSDDGYLFLLWDFRNPSMPLIHVRTWQPHKIVAEGEEIIDISDFNFE